MTLDDAELDALVTSLTHSLGDAYRMGLYRTVEKLKESIRAVALDAVANTRAEYINLQADN